jgi:hypothetical protein
MERHVGLDVAWLIRTRMVLRIGSVDGSRCGIDAHRIADDSHDLIFGIPTRIVLNLASENPGAETVGSRFRHAAMTMTGITREQLDQSLRSHEQGRSIQVSDEGHRGPV